MQTLITIVALVGSIASNNIPERPRWQSEYFEARSLAIEGAKPLVVFIGTGRVDWQKGVRDANDPKVNEWLRGKYIVVFVDTDTVAGKKLAADFGVDRVGLVISDRSGNSQQFHHSGALKRDDLLKAFQRYADPNRVFVATEALAQLSPPPVSPRRPASSSAPIFRLGGG